VTHAKQPRLSREQLAQIPVFSQRWLAAAFHSGPVERYRMKDLLYSLPLPQMQRTPVVHFCTGPLELLRQEAFLRARPDPEHVLWAALGRPLWQQLARELSPVVHRQLSHRLVVPIEQQLHTRLGQLLLRALALPLGHPGARRSLLHQAFATGGWRSHGAWFDYGRAVLGCALDERYWSRFAALLECGGWLIPTQDAVFCLDGPSALHQDDRGLLHAEGKPAVRFADGFSLYAHHGVLLQERYGRCHPSAWRPEWLLEETDVEICQVLTRILGHEQILAQLEAQPEQTDGRSVLYRVERGREVVRLLLTLQPEALLRLVPPQARTLKEAHRWLTGGRG
jgi:hypothetical protein